MQHSGLGVIIGQHATDGAGSTVQAIILAATITGARLPHDIAWQDQTRAEAILVGPKVTMRSTVPTKLRVPEIGAKLVFRPSLMHLLDEGLAHNLTLVSAPAGYGKTTSVAMWIRTLGALRDPGRPAEVRTAWYSLDAEDNDVSTFFMRFAAAIEAESPGALQAITSGLAVQAPPIHEFANTLAEACLKLPQSVVLVLDDYHLISDAGIHTIIFHLIQYASARLHVVIASRHDPPLRIARLRAHHQVAEVRVADLRLTEQETKELLQMRLAQQPLAELVAQLQSRAEGWVAGLQLAAAAVRGFADQGAFVDAFRRSNNLYVMDYLFDEVLIHQPEDVQEFLLKPVASILRARHGCRQHALCHGPAWLVCRSRVCTPGRSRRAAGFHSAAGSARRSSCSQSRHRSPLRARGRDFDTRGRASLEQRDRPAARHLSAHRAQPYQQHLHQAERGLTQTGGCAGATVELAPAALDFGFIISRRIQLVGALRSLYRERRGHQLLSWA